MIISNPFPPEEGIGNYVHNLSKKLMERGHKVTVITRGGLKRETFIFDSILVVKIPFIMIYPFHTDIHKIFLNSFIRMLEKNIDVIHIHTPLVPLVTTRLPVVTTFHSPQYVDSRKSIEVVNIKNFLLKALGILKLKNEKALVSLSTVVGSVSTGVKSDIERYYGILKPANVFGNAVSDKFLEAVRSREIVKDPMMILYVGRLDYQKGLIDLINSMKIVSQKEPNARLVIVGKGPLKQKLIRKISELNLQKQVELRGFHNRDQVLEDYLRASIFVSPSYSEGLPTTCLEAMACKNAVIATNVRGNSELIIANETGLLVPKHEPCTLGHQILRLLQDSQLRERLASNAHVRIKTEFTWDIVTNRVLESYNLAINKNVKN